MNGRSQAVQIYICIGSMDLSSVISKHLNVSGHHDLPIPSSFLSIGCIKMKYLKRGMALYS